VNSMIDANRTKIIFYEAGATKGQNSEDVEEVTMPDRVRSAGHVCCWHSAILSCMMQETSFMRPFKLGPLCSFIDIAP